MTILAQSAIKEAMRGTPPLVITPLLTEDQIGAASVDLRLGYEFIVWRRTSLPHIDRADPSTKWSEILHRSQQRLRARLFEKFSLHPGELVLGSTLEYLSLPRGLAASVEGRSSWGRLGLIVATATTVAPGFKGCLTLEIVNAGEVPLVVYPAMTIAQLVVQRADGAGEYTGKYQCPIGPEFTKPDDGWQSRFWGDHPPGGSVW